MVASPNLLKVYSYIQVPTVYFFFLDTVTVECEREGDERSLTVSAECTASREVVSMTCSIDDLQPQPCM